MAVLIMAPPKAIDELPEFLENLVRELRAERSLATSVEFTQKDERDDFGTRQLIVNWIERREQRPVMEPQPPPPNETVKKGG